MKNDNTCQLVARWATATCLLLLAGPAVADEKLNQARNQLGAHVQNCSVKNSYNPRTVTDIGPHKLAAGERAYLDCAYAGFEKYIVPNSSVPDLYKDTIAKHRDLTDKVESGEITREQRRRETNKLLISLRSQEQLMADNYFSTSQDHIKQIELEQRRMRQVQRFNQQTINSMHNGLLSR